MGIRIMVFFVIVGLFLINGSNFNWDFMEEIFMIVFVGLTLVILTGAVIIWFSKKKKWYSAKLPA